jgi:maltooligosyltrehalose trehalohydrolase
LRLDATHAVFDTAHPHVLAELAERVRGVRPSTLVISEVETGDERPLREWDHDAQWADELHHAVHVLVTGEHEGYYQDYGSVADVGNEFSRPLAGYQMVQNKLVRQQAFGDRLHGDRLRLARSVRSWLPASLLFMGEEYDESHPFQFFTDHIDPRSPRPPRPEGEFERFAAFAGGTCPIRRVETFLRSKLDREDADSDHRRYYRALLAAAATAVIPCGGGHRRRGAPGAPRAAWPGGVGDELLGGTMKTSHPGGVVRGAEGLAG